jgi:ABC-type protease/lipase transport system fused ATPase/permease subunit
MLLLRDGQSAAFGPRDEVLAALNKAAQSPAAAATA